MWLNLLLTTSIDAEVANPCGLWSVGGARKITKRGGSGWPRTQPTFPRPSTCIRFVGRLVGLPDKEPEEPD